MAGIEPALSASELAVEAFIEAGAVPAVDRQRPHRLTTYLEDFTAANPRALVFTGPKGAQLRRSNSTPAVIESRTSMKDRIHQPVHWQIPRTGRGTGRTVRRDPA
jgi:hypothetical protein